MKAALGTKIRERLIKERNITTFFAVGLLALCLLEALTIVKICTHQTVVVTPPEVTRSFWVSHNTVSESYLYEFSKFVAMARFNVSPSNVDEQKALLLKLVDPHYYGQLNQSLLDQSKKLKREHLSIAFYPDEIKVDKRHLKVLMSGNLMSQVGGKALPQKKLTVLITYRLNNARLYLTSMQEVEKGASV